MRFKQPKSVTSWLMAAALCGSLGLGSCGVPAPKTQLKDHAQTGAERAKIVKVTRPVLSGGIDVETVFGLVSGQGEAARIYYIDCPATDGSADLNAVQAFANAVGYAGDIRDLPAIDGYDGTPTGEQLNTWHGLGAGEQPALKCHFPAAEASLRKVGYPDATDKYFLTVTNQTVNNRRILYHLGCDRLARAMGFDPGAATAVPYSLMTQDYEFSDAYDLNCITGVPVGQGIAWDQGADAVIDVKPGDAIAPLTFTAKSPDRSYAPLTAAVEATPANASCSWVTTLNAGPSMIFLGTVPADFTNKSCKITITASSGLPLQDRKTVVLRNRLKPVLQTTCPATSQIVSLSDFNPCTVTADVGVVQIASQSCPNSFVYDAISKRLLLTIVPALETSCDVSVLGRNDDLVSDPLNLSVRRICGRGYTNKAGQCVAVSCDSTHVFGDHWQVAIEGGQINYSCNDSGQTITDGVACTGTGYEKSGNSCQKVKCDASHVYGDQWSVAIGNGSQNLRCEADRSISIKSVACNTGYNQSGNQCTRVFCGYYAGANRYYNDQWAENIPAGVQNKICSASGQVQNVSTLCNSGYMLSGGSCVAASCGSHPSGSSWTLTVAHGRRSYSCSYGTVSANGLTCDGGYDDINDACVKEVETDPPVCRKKPYLPQCNGGGG